MSIDSTVPDTTAPWLAMKPALEKSWEWQMGATAIVIVIAIGTLFYAISIAKQEERPNALFIWLGGALAAFYEPLGDLMAHVTYHEVNQITFFEALGFKIPLWLMPTYSIVVSSAVLWNMQRIKNGISVKAWTVSFFLLIPAAIIFELPLLFMDAINYFGPQPFSILGYPLAMAFANTAGLIFTNATLLHFLNISSVGHRWPALFILLVPMITAGAHLSVSLPWGLAMNATDNLTIINLMATVTMIFAVVQMWVCGQLVCTPTPSINHNKTR